jgi:aspartate--ammonia ligase
MDFPCSIHERKDDIMSRIIIPEGYRSFLSLRQTQYAIKKVKDFFERDLSTQLNLIRVSAPLFVDAESGLNDNLNGIERPVTFDALAGSKDLEIVHSLAKWKRYALKTYGFSVGEGLYTDMNAIRRDEETDNIHSMFVDQWDWEKIIAPEQRDEKTLRDTVKAIYRTLRHTENYIVNEYSFIGRLLPEDIHFITSQELEDRWPAMTPKEREYVAAKEYGAIFLMQIGGKLRSGKPHDGRAPDYDDWNLNGDIIVYYPILDIALELSSMGVRVDKATMLHQLEERGCSARAEMPFHKALLNGELPYTIGGGIGQSRMCMFFLRKAHIGEVQSSCWSEEDARTCEENGIHLL